MRLTPLLLIASLGKNVRGAPSVAQESVAQLLLHYGAKPDAKDIFGKTVCHYGMGAMATDMTIAVGKMCIDAYQWSHLFGKKVVLQGLQSAKMNGEVGECRGYVTATGRCAVYLSEQKNVLGIKPENMKLVNVVAEETEEKKGKLCDIPDRLGAVCLLEVVQAQRSDVARVLIHKYDARLDIEDCDGVSPKSMAIMSGAMNKVSDMINIQVAKHSRKQRGVDKCTNCGQKSSTKIMVCSLCKSTQYCSRECQKKHWKNGHKSDCSRLAQSATVEIILDKPSGKDGSMFFSVMNTRGNDRAPKKEVEGYRKPSSVKVGEKIYFKVQGGGPMMPLMIYDKTREFNISLQPGQKGFDALREKVNAEPAWQGRKTYVMACFDTEGRCKVFPGMTSIKKW